MTSSGCNVCVGYCTCVNGYFGPAFQYQCSYGEYGRNCRAACQCMNGALCNCSANAAGCNVFTGKCSCPAEYGALCDQLCATGWWGPGCINKCTCDNGTCGGVTGRCTCNPGYTGSTCNNPCAV
ncbi:multiple epidermal growth factor-like domains protein 10 isoform X1 [Corticium candelabrum]|uniref:multiple epidermal growth factor-like domains protein 10 isoform X1 n=1 Tax=Corticium candelabrum TaxID=121492 RepID=UPI002E253F77|nr:multiple epidermal growth factor-like domains protein 10 isoform X1 [Corticium candelabrum]